MYEHVEAEAGEDGVLELGVLVHDDGDDADVGQEAPRPPHHVLARQPVLPGRVEAPVVHRVVVALGQELDAAVLLLVQLQHAVHDRDVAALDLRNLEECQNSFYIPSFKNRLHANYYERKLQNQQNLKLPPNRHPRPHLEDDDLADPDVLVLVVGEEEEVAAVEGGLHGPVKFEKFIEISDFDYIITLNSMYTESVFQTYPERTTTMGDSDPVTTISPFQIISADDTIMPKLSTCKIHHRTFHPTSP